MRSTYKQIVPRPLLQILANVCLIMLIIGSFLPSKAKVWIGTQHPGDLVGTVSMQHRLFHIAAFGLTTLGFLLLERSRKGEVILSMLMCVLGCAIESMQSLLSQFRFFEWWDIRDDFYAVVAAFALIQMANWCSATEPAVTSLPGSKKLSLRFPI